jgi:putative multiple sugar transport system ATP-binding protein
VLRDGATVETMDRRADSEDRIIRDMVGRDMATAIPARRRRSASAVRGEGLERLPPAAADRQVIKDVDLNVRAGEVVGIAGLMGAGRTEFAMSLFGRSYGRNITGEVLMHAARRSTSTVPKAIAHGLAYVTEDRKAYGLVLIDHIKHNVTLANLPGVSRAGVIDDGRERTRRQRVPRALNIRTPERLPEGGNLSGGNQQKVVLSKWLFTDPEVLILDEPTRGIDVGAKYEIYTIINELARQGKA